MLKKHKGFFQGWTFKFTPEAKKRLVNLFSKGTSYSPVAGMVLHFVTGQQLVFWITIALMALCHIVLVLLDSLEKERDERNKEAE